MWVQSKNVWVHESFKPKAIEISDGVIKSLKDYGSVSDAVDYGDNRIIPGLIDIHDHGYKDLSANHSDVKGLLEWASYLPSEGVTSFLPTLATISQEEFLLALQNIAHTIDLEYKGAKMLGIHTEGVIISLEKKGAHDERLILKPTVELFKTWQEASNNKIVLVAIAPECDENHELIKYLVSEGIVVSIAHTNATYEQAIAAVESGAVSFTHTFNAMTGLQHRKPGVVSAAMGLSDTYAELICDGKHVDFAVGRLLGLIKGKDRLIAITDAMPTKGLKPGIYKKKGTQFNVILDESGVARLENGTLSGSSARMIDMVKNLDGAMNLGEVVAINAATINPARLLGLDKNKGLIKEKYDADIVIIDDEYKVLATYVAGEVVFEI